MFTPYCFSNSDIFGVDLSQRVSEYQVLGCSWDFLGLNSLAPGGFDYSLKSVNFKLISMINIWSTFCEIAIRWIPQYLSDHKLTLVQVMAWCRQATSHYLSQCWPRSCRHMTSLGLNELIRIPSDFYMVLTHCGIVMPHGELDIG